LIRFTIEEILTLGIYCSIIWIWSISLSISIISKSLLDSISQIVSLISIFISPTNSFFLLSKKQHSRKKGDTTKQSNNYKKQKAKVQKLHTKIYNQRKDYLHKISNEITNQYDIIALETLNVKGMVKNKRLSKSISDVAWSEFMRQLEYKALWKGKTVIKIDKWFPSSQICSYCGASTGKKPLNIRKFDCPECKTRNIDRDINASINIRNYALGQIDNRNTAGTVEIKACGVSSNGATSNVASYDMLKQEAQSSLAVG